MCSLKELASSQQLGTNIRYCYLVQGFVHAVRAIVLLGLFAMVGATAMTGVHVFCAKDNRLVMYASICLAAVAGMYTDAICFHIVDRSASIFCKMPMHV